MKTTVSTDNKVRGIAINGIVMALYLALTILVAPVATGAVQFRVSESLNHLVVFNRKLMWGVLGGVIVFNLFFGFGVIDALYGGAQTFFSLGLTALIYKKVPKERDRLILNTVFFTISMVFIAFMLVPTGGKEFWTTYLTLAISEAIIMGLSAPVMYGINKVVQFEKRL
ncbi:QueT transporter family protein [Enterococcus rivorum]|uniref:QueT transporter family protein n=1 Tax=Enterococcus rivorum TaxID=762845 RepID=A0A1E5KUK4_9ENTE|nr:QueT transporter family protein [Enterococcus rivorum]MBP2100589.1 putative membrane protein [Enterococcus rivorum]OEH81562.1 hypothetical protein BCR26_16460 [Enterococcus rivorum]